MFRRKEDINKFKFKEIIENIKNFIFSQKCKFLEVEKNICAGEAFLQRKSNFLKLKKMKI